MRVSNHPDLFDNTPKLAQLVSVKVGGKFKRILREDVELRFLIMKYEHALEGKAPKIDDVNTLAALMKLADKIGTRDISFGDAIRKLSSDARSREL
ncbi:hypothetical protein ACC716_34580 [Rhizobium johnstonii]|uniref:hypothetical protein n=1 Tax=Rhizobium TaxID=379 RepID=UPI00102FCCFE|nr:hypothetical protein [Rhizobium leguminosarum]TBH54601.1 hypothetical protein ELG62_14025 [Rhizobium leguminosarum]